MEAVRILPEPAVPQTVEVAAGDGVRLVGERFGDGTPVLFAHGFGQTRQAWRASAAALAAHGYAATAFDGRGHGDSGRNPEGLGYRIEQFVEDVHALATTDAAPPVWVGASMGGLLGMLAEGESSAPLFSALVLVDITPRWEQRGVERILGFMRAHPDGFGSMHQAIDAIAAYLPHRPRKTPQQLESLLRAGADGRLRWHWDPRLLDQMAGISGEWQQRLMCAATNLRLPTLLVSGGRSDLVSEHTVDEFLALAPHARHVRIDDATHMVAGDRNDQFTSTILDFLEATAASPVANANGAAP